MREDGESNFHQQAVNEGDRIQKREFAPIQNPPTFTEQPITAKTREILDYFKLKAVRDTLSKASK